MYVHKDIQRYMHIHTKNDKYCRTRESTGPHTYPHIRTGTHRLRDKYKHTRRPEDQTVNNLKPICVSSQVQILQFLVGVYVCCHEPLCKCVRV